MITLPPEEESIFTAARALSDPEKRRQYLDVACEGDRERRQTIEELLDAAEAAETFFRDPAAALIASHADEMNLPKPGKVMRYFGDYEVEEEIGRGGMGVIYRARQQ
jgi:eukaryotic-like serine/threonine-protein kinase